MVPLRPPIVWPTREKQTPRWEASSVVSLSVRSHKHIKDESSFHQAARESNITNACWDTEKESHLLRRQWQTDRAHCKQSLTHMLEKYTVARHRPQLRLETWKNTHRWTHTQHPSEAHFHYGGMSLRTVLWVRGGLGPVKTGKPFVFGLLQTSVTLKYYDALITEVRTRQWSLQTACNM